MNVKKLEKLAKFLKTLPKRKFNMDNWVSWRTKDTDGSFFYDSFMDENGKDGALAKLDPAHCKSAACVAGWQVYLEYPSKKDRANLEDSAENIATVSLGLTGKQACWLFSGSWAEDEDGICDQDIFNDPKEGAKAIKRLIKDPKIAKNVY